MSLTLKEKHSQFFGYTYGSQGYVSECTPFACFQQIVGYSRQPGQGNILPILPVSAPVARVTSGYQPKPPPPVPASTLFSAWRSTDSEGKRVVRGSLVLDG